MDAIKRIIKNRLDDFTKADELELQIYELVKCQFEENIINTGLLAKVEAENDFDELRSKAAYIREATKRVLTKSTALLAALREVKELDEKIKMLDVEKASLNEVIDAHQADDLELDSKIINDFVDQKAESLKNKHQKKILELEENKDYIFGASSSVIFLLIFLMAGGTYIALGLFIITLLIFKGEHSRRKKISQEAEDIESQLKQMLSCESVKSLTQDTLDRIKQEWLIKNKGVEAKLSNINKEHDKLNAELEKKLNDFYQMTVP